MADSSNVYRWMYGTAFLFGLRPYRLETLPHTDDQGHVQRPQRRPTRLHLVLSGVGLFFSTFCIAATAVSFALFHFSVHFEGAAISPRISAIGQMQTKCTSMANLLLMMVTYVQVLVGASDLRRTGDLLVAVDRQLRSSDRATGADETMRRRREQRAHWLMEALCGLCMLALIALLLAMIYFSLHAVRSKKLLVIRIFLVNLPNLHKQITVFSYVYQLAELADRNIRLNGVLKRRLKRIEEEMRTD